MVDEEQISPEEQVDAKRKLLVFAEALSTVPAAERAVFVMRRIEGLQFARIADRLNISVSTAERRSAYAMLRCCKYLEACGIDPSEFNASLGERKKPGGKLVRTVANRRSTDEK